MTHSPEPWIVSHLGEIKCNHIDIISIGQLSTVIRFGATFPSTEDRKRIVACVNACAGIPTSALEVQSGECLTASQIVAMRENHFIREELDRVKQQRNELLAALARLAGYCSRMRMPGCPPSDSEKLAAEAIAKAGIK